MKSVAAAERYGRGAWRQPEQPQSDDVAVRIDAWTYRHRKKQHSEKINHHFLVLIVGKLLRKTMC
jgi:hypothetical protein